ncbi:UNKNOWN [Stylonychia lemnae]|uniref:Uncharacterized protein n=1 Tax=Stylonychia lemnae TaxID=5949 RepID=A0A078ARP7_STYLE|nr:UNKNOWN [Stylonychia lemnae]|eukprot:CDW84656.1 UNKNOWN [Stylonychia lemnae]
MDYTDIPNDQYQPQKITKMPEITAEDVSMSNTLVNKSNDETAQHLILIKKKTKLTKKSGTIYPGRADQEQRGMAAAINNQQSYGIQQEQSLDFTKNNGDQLEDSYSLQQLSSAISVSFQVDFYQRENMNNFFDAKDSTQDPNINNKESSQTSLRLQRMQSKINQVNAMNKRISIDDTDDDKKQQEEEKITIEPYRRENTKSVSLPPINKQKTSLKRKAQSVQNNVLHDLVDFEPMLINTNHPNLHRERKLRLDWYKKQLLAEIELQTPTKYFGGKDKKSVQFRDEVNDDLCEVVFVESYKQYYQDPLKVPVKCACSCNIY